MHPDIVRLAKLVKNLVSDKETIAYRRAFAQVAGSATAGLFLSQLFYWSDKTKDPEGWFYKTAEEWKSELYLTTTELSKARSALKAKGILEEIKKGVPCKVHYRLNMDRLVRLLDGLDPVLNEYEILSIYGEKIHKLSKSGALAAANRGTEYEYVDYLELLKQKGFVCGICGHKIQKGPGKRPDSLCFDHIIPISRGGKHIATNIQPAHSFCNGSKRNKLPEEYTPSFTPSDYLVPRETQNQFDAVRKTSLMTSEKLVFCETGNSIYIDTESTTENTSQNTSQNGAAAHTKGKASQKEEDRKLAELFGQTLEEDQEPMEQQVDPSTDSMAKEKKDPDPVNHSFSGENSLNRSSKKKGTLCRQSVQMTSRQGQRVLGKHSQVRALIGQLTDDVDGFIKWRISHLASTSYYKDNGIKVVESTVLESYAKGLPVYGSDAEKAQAIADVTDKIKAHIESWPQRQRKAQQDDRKALFDEIYALYKKDPAAAMEYAQGLRVWNQFVRERLNP